ncbi:hypothetical protein BH11CYA1_BH11CYA1_25790 [soil metagenome]
MSTKNAVIIVDSGFSRDAVAKVKKLIAFYDLTSGITVTGTPFIAGEQSTFVLDNLCHDPLNHGTVILQRLLELNGDCAIILVRAFAGDSLIRTAWVDGKIVRDGWIEAYVSARQLCQSRAMTSVANLSFGGFGHAQDGSGWESFNLSNSATSERSRQDQPAQNLAGHILVAACGPGDGRAIHCSFTSSETTFVQGFQRDTSTYNLWVDRNVSSNSQHSGWHLKVMLNGREVAWHEGKFIAPNMWNDRQQLTFVVEGEGHFEFAITAVAHSTPTRFDVFISQTSGASFFDNVDTELVSEPACLSQVIAVGLQHGSYGRCNVHGVAKPEIKLPGDGPISFRTPEITFAVATLLEVEPTLDVAQVRQRLLAQYCS